MTVTADLPEAAQPLWRPGVEPESSSSDLETSSAGRKSLGRKLLSEGSLIAALCFVLYLVGAIVLDFHYLTWNGDAVSRMANGFYMLYSRDPHIAAVGFVWQPGTSFLDLIPLLFYHLWTPLVTHAFATGIMSAAAMAGAVYQVRCALAEWGVSRAPRLILVGILALNAMIVYYGANGMSEAPYLFGLVACSRYLLRWLIQDDLGSLVYAGIALGLCYLVRNEAGLAAILSGPLVLGVGYARRPSTLSRSSRIWGAVTDATIYELPFFVTAVGWAIIGYVITGNGIQRISLSTSAAVGKAVGNAATAGPATPLHVALMVDLKDILYMAPTLPLLILLAIYFSAWRRDVGLLAPLSVVGGGIGFSALSYVIGFIPPYYRYFIGAVPLEVLVAGAMFATRPALVKIDPGAAARRPRGLTARTLRAVTASVVALTLVGPSTYTTVSGMFNSGVGIEETAILDFIGHKHLNAQDIATKNQFKDTFKIVDYLTAMHMKPADLLVDNSTGCIPTIVVDSPNPKIFVIPNDRDYQKRLDDPLTFKTRYILETEPVGFGAVAAMAVQYPNLWSGHVKFAHEIHDFPHGNTGCPEFRLFRVTGHPNGNF